MTNKEYLSTLSNEDWHMLVDWLFHKYALRFTNSRIAIIEWLDKEHNEIRWTDKLSIKSNGDIIDFKGRVVGHINLEEIKGE